MAKYQHINWEGIKASDKNLIIEYADYRYNTMNKALDTCRNHSAILRQLSISLKEKPLTKADEKDIQNFLGKYKQETRDLYATCLILFYRHILKLKRKQRPPFLEYYDYQTAKDRERRIDPNRKEKYFITRKEYDTLIEHSDNLQDRALWECLYLSGARCGEICSMNIEDLKQLPQGYQITVRQSKTRPREIPLTEHPEHLIRYLEHHPNKNNPQSPMWISKSNRRLHGRLNTAGVDYKFQKLLRIAKIKKSLTPHCFRRTRATLMFPKYNDKEMSLIFGWRVNAVPERRAEYDLTDYKDLKAKVFNGTTTPPSYDKILQEKKSLENELNLIKKQIADQEQRIREMITNEVRQLTTQNPGKDHIDIMSPKTLGRGKKYDNLYQHQKQIKKLAHPNKNIQKN